MFCICPTWLIGLLFFSVWIQQMEQILEREENSRAELAEFTERIDELRIELARHQNIMEQGGEWHLKFIVRYFMFL